MKSYEEYVKGELQVRRALAGVGGRPGVPGRVPMMVAMVIGFFVGAFLMYYPVADALRSVTQDSGPLLALVITILVMALFLVGLPFLMGMIMFMLFNVLPERRDDHIRAIIRDEARLRYQYERELAREADGGTG